MIAGFSSLWIFAALCLYAASKTAMADTCSNCHNNLY